MVVDHDRPVSFPKSCRLFHILNVSADSQGAERPLINSIRVTGNYVNLATGLERRCNFQHSSLLIFSR